MSDIMNECVIEWIKGDKVAGVTMPNNTKLKNRILKIAETRKEVEVTINDDGSISAGWTNLVGQEDIHIFGDEGGHDGSAELLLDMDLRSVAQLLIIPGHILLRWVVTSILWVNTITRLLSLILGKWELQSGRWVRDMSIT